MSKIRSKYCEDVLVIVRSFYGIADLRSSECFIPGMRILFLAQPERESPKYNLHLEEGFSKGFRNARHI